MNACWVQWRDNSRVSGEMAYGSAPRARVPENGNCIGGAIGAFAMCGRASPALRERVWKNQRLDTMDSSSEKGPKFLTFDIGKRAAIFWHAFAFRRGPPCRSCRSERACNGQNHRGRPLDA
jgi:hypothetical protein